LRGEEKGGESCDLLAARWCRSAPTDPPPATTSIRDGSAGRWRSSTLAVGDNLARDIALTALGAALLALVTVAGALGVVAYLVMRREDLFDRVDKAETALAGASLVLGIVALALAETAAAEVLLAVSSWPRS
jgi:hypothetical protein